MYTGYSLDYEHLILDRKGKGEKWGSFPTSRSLNWPNFKIVLPLQFPVLTSRLWQLFCCCTPWGERNSGCVAMEKLIYGTTIYQVKLFRNWSAYYQNRWYLHIFTHWGKKRLLIHVTCRRLVSSKPQSDQRLQLWVGLFPLKYHHINFKLLSIILFHYHVLPKLRSFKFYILFF